MATITILNICYAVIVVCMLLTLCIEIKSFRKMDKIVDHLRMLDSIYMEQLTELEDNLEIIKKATKQLTGKEERK